MDECTDSKLYVAMNLAFACSLRIGEILGLTWKNVHIEDENIAADNAYVYIEAELTRASKQAIEMLGEKDIFHIFTPLMPNTSTRLILKKPKTESSIRKMWLPKTVAYILRERKKAQQELKEFLGDEYQDFDLVVALPNGRPCENRIIEKEFSLLKQKVGLPNVVFHSLRHSSTTYKLKLNHGDLKATQRDTGHAEIDMITKVYAHILDEDRKINAQKFESAFYANPDLRNVNPTQEPEQPQAQTLDLAALIEQLQKSPGKHSGRPYRGAGSRKIGVGNQISKPLIFLSRLAKTVRVQLADIHHAAHKNLPVDRSRPLGGNDKINAANPRKRACSGVFGTPGETRTHYLTLRRENVDCRSLSRRVDLSRYLQDFLKVRVALRRSESLRVGSCRYLSFSQILAKSAFF